MVDPLGIVGLDRHARDVKMENDAFSLRDRQGGVLNSSLWHAVPQSMKPKAFMAKEVCMRWPYSVSRACSRALRSINQARAGKTFACREKQ